MHDSGLDLVRRSQDEDSVGYVWALADGRRTQTTVFGCRSSPGLRVSTATCGASGGPSCEAGCPVPARDLTAGEISGQVAGVGEDCRARGVESPLRFVTLSGIGEPLLNYDNVVQAAQRMYEQAEVAVVSVTTSGVVPGLYRLADESAYIQLRVRLHASEDETRRRLFPGCPPWDIAEVVLAAGHFARRWRRRVIVDYPLVPGVNDTDDDATRLRELLDPELFEVHFLVSSHAPAGGRSGARRPGQRDRLTTARRWQGQAGRVTATR